MSDALSAFFLESDSHLEVIEQSLLGLEQAESAETINELFRAVHSLKGNSGLVGFMDIHAVATEMETLMDEVRKGKKKLTQDVKDALFKDLDKMKGMIEKARGGPSASKTEETAEVAPPPPKPVEKPKAAVNAPVETAPAPAEGQEHPDTVPTHDARHRHGGKQSFLTFNLGSEEYGIPITTVKEIILKRHITRVPNAKTYVVGIMNLRGMVIPVINSRVKLGKSAGAETAENIIIVEFESSITGVLVDCVKDIVAFEEDMIVSGKSVLGNMQSKFIEGVGKADKKTIILLDVANFCDPAEKYF
ncbi:MAG: chemotaxis protein CheW [Nitrospinae bacterium]|nr:chemotaxis protein CheW [Nitrospinota bacterium]